MRFTPTTGDNMRSHIHILIITQGLAVAWFVVQVAGFFTAIGLAL
jgi:hypothetical protein